MPETYVDPARIVAERNRRLVKGLSFTTAGTSLNVTASFGTMTYPDEETKGVDDFIGKADEALYEVKAAGRNRVIVRQ